MLLWLWSWFPHLKGNSWSWQTVSTSKTQNFCEFQTPLGKLFEGLHGTKIVIPSIEALSPIWRLEVNPHLESVRSEYKAWVHGYMGILITLKEVHV